MPISSSARLRSSVEELEMKAESSAPPEQAARVGDRGRVSSEGARQRPCECHAAGGVDSCARFARPCAAGHVKSSSAFGHAGHARRFVRSVTAHLQR